MDKIKTLEELSREIDTGILKIYDKRAIMASYARTNYDRAVHVRAGYHTAEMVCKDSSNNFITHVQVFEMLLAKYSKERADSSGVGK